MRNPGTLLKTAQDVRNLGFMSGAEAGLNLNIKPYRATQNDSKTWDTTRQMTWNTQKLKKKRSDVVSETENKKKRVSYFCSCGKGI